MKVWESLHPQLAFSQKMIDGSELQGVARYRRERRKIGRVCGEQALSAAGYQISGDVESKAFKTDVIPCWPEGFVGSITYTKDFAMAAVAQQDAFKSVGIDAERVISEATLAKIEKFIASDAEQRLFSVALCKEISKEEFYTILFSAKESIYKCFYPLIQKIAGFQDVEIVSIDLKNNKFEYKFIRTLSQDFPYGYRGEGFVNMIDDNIYTLVHLEQLPAGLQKAQ
ncbi:MAG: hypothetical protein CMP10_03870 [Zetaproteobacteria bacterium]|nr:hypothetical protein [Pseudobdellovibrionaceae bacterium]